jgi:hypothetical protein
MFATLFVLFNSIVMMAESHRVSHHTSSPHVLPNTAVFDDSILCMSSLEYYTLAILAIVPISAFISVLVTSQLYKRNMLAIIGAAFRQQPDYESETESDSEPEEETAEEKYIQQYPIKRATHCPPKNLDELGYTIMVETTPRGTVLMCYNAQVEGFEYWSDADIPLVMLEAAARRYVTENNCKQFYKPRAKTNAVDKDAPPTNETTETQQPASSGNETEEEDDGGVFIKRKKTPAQLKLEKQIAEEEQVTRFIKKGRLNDFKPKDLFKHFNMDEQVVKTTLNYDTFKKAMAESMAASDPIISTSRDYASIRDACDAGVF